MSSEYLVEPSKIEQQLNVIWDLLRGKGKVRASLFNLVIYTEKNTRVDYLYKVAQKLIEKFPSRVLFITIDESAPKNTLKTSVSAIASDAQHNMIACDFINILLSSDNKERAPFMILPHLLADLPVYLLWGDDPTRQDPTSRNIEKLATRVIFDSETTEDLSLFAKAILEHQKASSSDIADLNWARIEGWRQLFAQTFKSEDQYRSLKKIQSLKIVYNCLKSPFFCHTKIQSQYLQGWLATQCGWEFQKCEKKDLSTHIDYVFENRNIHVILEPTSQAFSPPGRIMNILLETTDQEKFQFLRSKKQDQIIHIQHSTPLFCHLTSEFIFDKYESGLSLVKEIFHKGTSPHFLALTKHLAALSCKDYSL